MEILRTPDERFQNLAGYAFEPRYADVGGLRMHYLDEGPASAPPVLLLHGEPSWSYLYRKMIPILTQAGLRAIAPDLIGFGRSDKPARREDYSYQRHVDWTAAFLKSAKLERIHLVCQDWGGLIGLRLVAELEPLFASVVAANTFLPTGDLPTPDAFFAWQRFSQESPVFDVGSIVARGCTSELSPEIVKGYDAPFPDDRYKQGARQFPLLVPTRSDDPASEPNRRAWQVLSRFEKPFLTAFSDQDPITKNADRFLQKAIPGARDRAHTTITGAGHFLQEDAGEALGRVVADFVREVAGLS
jgi:haloalkane dehalogenase